MAGQLIYSKMNAVQKDIKAIGKDQTNAQQGFKFRGIDQFVNSLYPALTRHGVVMTTEVLDYRTDLREVVRGNGKTGTDSHAYLKVKYTFHAEDGSSISSTLVSEGLDSGDKATNKALSAALKYALIQTFSIPTEDMEEGDRVSPEAGVRLSEKSPTELTKSAVAPAAKAPLISAAPSSTIPTSAPKAEAPAPAPQATAAAPAKKPSSFKRPSSGTVNTNSKGVF
jgi:hypothetical protein